MLVTLGTQRVKIESVSSSLQASPIIGTINNNNIIIIIIFLLR